MSKENTLPDHNAKFSSFRCLFQQPNCEGHGQLNHLVISTKLIRVAKVIQRRHYWNKLLHR